MLTNAKNPFLLSQKLNNKWVALVDCNNFFVSCERKLNPTLDAVPIAILSSNDGCIIARSEEVKAIGVAMGVPYFKVKQLLIDNGVKVFSLNYKLYTDVSALVMKTIQEYTPEVQIYSIDEAFINLTGFDTYINIEQFCIKLRNKLWDELHIPVSIGVARSKVLAKIANKIAKKRKNNYVELINSEDKRLALLKNTQLEDVWGIGNRTAKKMRFLGINTAYDLSQTNPKLLGKIANKNIIYLIKELNEISCFPFNSKVKPKKHIATSRSFGREIKELKPLESAIEFYVSRAVEKLWMQESTAGKIGVYLCTNRFRDKKIEGTRRRAYIEINFKHPTNYPPDILKAAIKGLREIYQPNFLYKKGGIILLDIHPESTPKLFKDEHSQTKHKILTSLKTIRKISNKNVVVWADNIYHRELTNWKPLNQFESDYTDSILDNEDDAQIAQPWW